MSIIASQWSMLLLISSLVVLQASSSLSSGATALDDYVNAPDDTYSYKLIYEYEGPGFTTYYLNMTSQKWLTDADSSRSIWWHYLLIHFPDDIKYTDHAFLYIARGGNIDGMPTLNDADVKTTTSLAVSTGVVTAALFQVPNQPIVFTADTLHKDRTEDALVAYTFYHYCNVVNDPEYVAYLPMTKAAVRAMDTVVEFSAEIDGPEISKFMMGGASKRGWVTWLTAAVDKRVVAIVPIVIDILNVVKNLHHHYQTYGGWSFAFHDYYELNITAQLDDPCFQTMLDFIDPIVYKDRLTMPKYIVTALGDEFFLPDGSIFYLNDLQGVTYISVVITDKPKLQVAKISKANVTRTSCRVWLWSDSRIEHEMIGHDLDVWQSVRAFALSLLQNYTLPKVSWELTQTADMGYITVETDTTPSYIMLWHANTIGDQTRRDFRLFVGPDPDNPHLHPVVWLPANVTMTNDGRQYVGQGKKPDKGWQGFIIEMGFLSPDDSLFVITTQVNFIPDTLPFPDCHGNGCLGTLV